MRKLLEVIFWLAFAFGCVFLFIVFAEGLRGNEDKLRYAFISYLIALFTFSGWVALRLSELEKKIEQLKKSE